MLAPRRGLHFVLVLALALASLSSFVAAQQPDQVVAERVLGPEWKQLSQRAGMIFAGTVVAPATQVDSNRVLTAERLVTGTSAGMAPVVKLSFRVDEAIAGVEQGQVLTIREWAGASPGNRPMGTGQHFLMFLYPPSRLGLTSPVGGSMGHIALGTTTINLVQLARAIRGARGE